MKARSMPKKRSASGPSARTDADRNRCLFTRSDGYRCQMSRAPRHASLCLFHARQEQEFAQAEEDVSQELLSLSGELKTSSDVNHVLRKLFSLLAQRRISRRDAIAFAYIAQLILQTLPGVRREVEWILGSEAWRETLEAALGIDDDDEVETENELAETDEAENGAVVEAEVQQPTSLSELASLILAGHAQSRGGSRAVEFTPRDHK